MTAYLYVDDADALAAEWRETGADIRSPEDTPWGQREGVEAEVEYGALVSVKIDLRER